MTDHDAYGDGSPVQQSPRPARSYWRIAVWIAIGSLIAAGLVCVIWVLVGGSQNGLIARAFLTILLLAAFAGAALFDASVSARREQWYILVSMVGWVVALLAGALKIWLPLEPFDWSDSAYSRFLQLVGIVLVVRLAILHANLFLRAVAKDRTSFTRIVGISTVAIVAALALLLVVPLLLPRVEFGDFYWRLVVAVSILAAIGTALVPLVRALNSPRAQATPYPGQPPAGYGSAPYGAPQAYGTQVPPAPYGAQNPPAPQGWPTYADARTPLPVMPDGSPDWNAYYTGQPSFPQPGAGGQAFPSVEPSGSNEHAPASAQQHASYGQHLGVAYPPPAPGSAQGGGSDAPPAPPVPPAPPAPPAPPQP